MIRALARLLAVAFSLGAIGFALSPRSALASSRRPSLVALEGEIMCPTCHTTLDQSDAPIAIRIEAFIRARIAAGDTKQQIVQRLVAQFGPAILAAPPHKGFDLLAWWLPLGGVAIGAGSLAIAVWRWRGADPGEAEESELASSSLDADLTALLDRELAKFEA